MLSMASCANAYVGARSSFNNTANQKASIPFVIAHMYGSERFGEPRHIGLSSGARLSPLWGSHLMGSLEEGLPE